MSGESEARGSFEDEVAFDGGSVEEESLSEDERVSSASAGWSGARFGSVRRGRFLEAQEL